MSINYQQNKDGTLRDPSGDIIGKVETDGKVRDGWQDKGYIDEDGKYHDEYGQDRGWTVQDSNGGSGEGALIAVLVLMLVSLFTGILSTKTGRRIAGIVSVIALAATIILGIGYLALNALDSQARDSEAAWVSANPDSVITIIRIGDGPCYGENCEVKTGRYTITSNLRTLNVRLNGCGFYGFGSILGPGESTTNDCEEERYGEKVNPCFPVSVIKQPGFDAEYVYTDRQICYH